MGEFLFIDSYPEDHDGEEVFVSLVQVFSEDEVLGSTELIVAFDVPLNANTSHLLPPGDMHEPPPYTGELDWHNDGSELLHPFYD